MRNILRRNLILLGTILLILASCGTTHKLKKVDLEDYVWPLPPDPPRIQYVRSIHSEMDVGRKRTLAQRIFEAIFGRPFLRSLKKPLGVHADKTGRVLVVDTGWRKVLVFDFKNHMLDVLGRRGRGRLLNPLGVTTDEQGRIYVTDAGGYRIMIYNSDGKFLKAYGGKDIFLRPAGIAVNLRLGKIFVVDTWAHQIKVLDSNTGELLFFIGKQGETTGKGIEGALDITANRSSAKGEFRFPTQIAMDSEGRIYVVDTLNFRVQIFNPTGELIHVFGRVGNLPGNFYRPKGIGLDSDGHIYVSDASFNNVQIFDQKGKLLLSFGAFGSGLADLRLPAGMYIDEHDKIYIVDQFNNRIQVYQYLGGKAQKDSDLSSK